MNWMKERDLLIAQTNAFVESVTGKNPDSAWPTAAPEAAIPVIRTPPLPKVEPVLTEHMIAVPPKPAEASRIDLPGDLKSEIRARIATFRAHQQRFSNEREEYCRATMAKVRAVLSADREPPHPAE
jgi:hypothetical protein